MNILSLTGENALGMTDEQIMLQVKSGRLDQLSVLFQRYQLPLYNFFVRLTQDEQLSEDFTQNVFERILKYRHSYKNEASFRSWIYQIARNVRTDHYRLNKVRIDANADLPSLSLEADSFLDRMEAREEEKQLERAIAQLKDEYREVLLLGWIERMKYAEVSEILGISEANVKVRMHRAVKQLRNIVQQTEC
jgi:RNA polymerase sigma-70 factor (ECF subfamily)